MKVAASDYDGTLFRQDNIAAVDVAGIRKWRQAGHCFGVVTGRDYGMLAPQLTHYGISFDYAVCNNGGIICRQDGTVLWQGRIDPAALQAILLVPGVDRSLHYAFSAAGKTFLCHEREGSWITREAVAWKFPLVEIKESEVGSLPQIHQLSLGYEDPEEAQAISDTLNERLGTMIHAYPNRGSVDITPLGISKQQGIQQLIELMGWKNVRVYAIGDETNDLPMIRAFDGYTVDTARAVIQQQARGSYPGVGAMLEANL